LLLVCSLVFALFVGELFLRFAKPIKYREPPIPIPSDIWCELLHKKSTIPGLRYELVPNMEKVYFGINIKTNSHGMRDREYRIKKSPDIFRIAAVGDSVTFGLGVSADETYPKVLENLLNNNRIEDSILSRGTSTSDIVNYQVLNFGTVGYCTRDESIYLDQRVLPWNPDLVIIGFVLNDAETDPVQPIQSYYQDPEWWQHLNILRLLAKAKLHYDVFRLGKGEYLHYLYEDKDKWNTVVKSFDKIKKISKQEGFEVILVIFPRVHGDIWEQYPYHNIHRKVSETASRNGFQVIDLFGEYAKHKAPDLRVSPTDGHPNALGHRLAAESIYKKRGQGLFFSGKK